MLAGIGGNVLAHDHSGATALAEGLQDLINGADPSTLTQSVRVFAQYAQQPGNDLHALAAVMRRPPGADITAEALGELNCPVLVVVGEDDFVHPADEFAAAFANGSLVTLPRTDHFATTDAFGFFDAALEFVGAA